MSILQEIQKWSQKLPAWQQHAIALLYAERQLGGPEIEEVYALLKAAHGIPDPEDIVAIKLADDQVAAPQVPDRLVQIVAIKNLQGVNALAEGQRLPISPTGLTIIYGENGAGKSGYSRVLKKACRARDQREPILPDARKAPAKGAVAQAVFELMVDGQPMDVDWSTEKESPEQLSEIAIFDAHCARAYVDNQGDFAYAPYGLDILEGLVKLCMTLRGMATKERDANMPNVEPFALLAGTKTKVGALLSSISAKTNPADVQVLAVFGEEDQKRLAILNKTLAEADPKQKASDLRLRASLLSGLITRIAEASSVVSEERLNGFRMLVQRSNEAKATARLAANTFAQTPGLLPGTGGEAWKELFEKARAFVAESHAGHELQGLDPEAQCPLCQNPLGDEGAKKLAAFDAFVQQEAEKTAKAARAAGVAAYRAIEQGNINLALGGPLMTLLESIRVELPGLCAEMQAALTGRRDSALKASASGAWDVIAPFAADPHDELTAAAVALIAEANALELSMDENAKSALVVEQAELDARRRLAEFKTLALETIDKFVLTQKLQACINDTGTTAISRQSTELSRTMATQEVADELNAELKELKVHELQVTMRSESPGGKTQFKLALQYPGGGTVSSILSEGEQRAIAIASFLAEIKLGKGLGGIVFDDPVSSLDHRRRWEVARRLAVEARHRQVIVLTHDIYFLCILQQQADEAGLHAQTQCIHKTAAGFGVQTDRLPFDTLSTSKRVKALRTMHEGVAQLHKAGEQEQAKQATRLAYSHLRMGWERGVEEVLFQGVVTRFDEGISTLKLRYVVVEDADHAVIDKGMRKSSKFAGHDPAAAANLPTPHPDELRADIDELEAWRKTVEDRKAAVEARRTA